MRELNTIPDTALVTACVAAATCGLHIATWHANVRAGTVPPHTCYIGRYKRWNMGMIRAFCEGRYRQFPDGTWAYDQEWAA